MDNTETYVQKFQQIYDDNRDRLYLHPERLLLDNLSSVLKEYPSIVKHGMFEVEFLKFMMYIRENSYRDRRAKGDSILIPFHIIDKIDLSKLPWLRSLCVISSSDLGYSPITAHCRTNSELEHSALTAFTVLIASGSVKRVHPLGLPI